MSNDTEDSTVTTGITKDKLHPFKEMGQASIGQNSMQLPKGWGATLNWCEQSNREHVFECRDVCCTSRHTIFHSMTSFTSGFR